MASELNIDAKFLRNMKDANEVLRDIVNSADNVTNALKAMTNASNAFSVMAKMQAGMAKLANKKVEVDVDMANVERLSELIDSVLVRLTEFSKSGLKVFDSKNIESSASGILDAERNLQKIKNEIKQIKEEYRDTFKPFQAPEFEVPTKLSGRKVRVDSQEYKDAKALYDKEMALEEQKYNIQQETNRKLLEEKRTRKQEELKAAELDLKTIKRTAAEESDFLIAQMKRVADAAKAVEREEREAYLSTPEGALSLAKDARNEKAMKEAQEYLVKARSVVDESDVQTIAKLNDEHTRLRISLEKITNAEKNEQTLIPSVANEYKRLLKELKKVQDAKTSLLQTNVSDSDLPKAQQAHQDLLARELDLQEKIKTIREASQGKLEIIEREHRAKMAAETVAELEAADKKRLQQIAKYGALSSEDATSVISSTDSASNVAQRKKAIKELEEAREKLNEEDADYDETLANLNKRIAEHTHQVKLATDATYRKQQAEKAERQTNTTFQGAMRYSSETESIKEQIQAIQYLKEARKNLNRASLGDDEYVRQVRELNTEIKRQEAAIESLEGKTRGVASSIESLSRRLLAAFSIYQISNYIQKLAEVRGEFELQHKALSAIIQDQKEANKLWDKTVALAVQSPFRVKELVTYTKQLAAYRVETGKLFDTTKMLADISAGLGVDMQRLILAYGQVKAANYLRGTELRQFSEAGINVLGELAAHFTELEGKAVSVAEVFERVSKRGVTFENVDAVLRKLTSSSGIFYKMQEKQAETLQGQMSNLRDAYELMLNDIGKKNDGYLKSSIQALRFLVSNWESIATVVVPILESATVGLMVFYGKIFFTSEKVSAFAKSFKSYLKSILILVTQGKKALNSFAAAASINPFGAWAAVIGVAVVAITNLIMRFVKLGWELKKINKEADEAKKAITDLNGAFIAAGSDKNPYEKQKAALQEIIALANKKYKMEISVDLEKYSPEDMSNLAAELTHEMMELSSVSAEFEKKFVKQSDKWFTHGIDKDIKQFQKAASELNNLVIANRLTTVSALTKNAELTDVQSKALGILKKARNEKNESELQWLEKIKNAYISLYKEYEKPILDLDDVNRKTGYYKQNEVENAKTKLKNEFRELTGISYSSFESIYDNYIGLLDEARAETKDFLKGTDWTLDKGILEQRFTFSVDELSTKYNFDDFMENQFLRWIEAESPVPISIVPKYTPPPSTILNSWQQKYNSLFKDADNFQEIKNIETTRDDIIKYWQEVEKELKEVIGRIKKNNKGAYEGVDIKDYEAELKIAQRVLSWFGVVEKIKGKGKGKDWFSEMAKSIKDTHKEFISLHKNLEKTAALEEAIKKNEAAFSEAAKNAGLNVTLHDFEYLDSENGAIISLLALLDLVPEKAKNAKLNINKFIGDITGEDTVAAAEKAAAALEDSFNALFGDYEMSIDLKAKGFNVEWASEFFGLDNTSLDDIRAKIRRKLGRVAQYINDDESLKDAIQESSLDETTRDILLDNLQKLIKKESELLEERLKQYMDYSKKTLSEVGKIRLQEAQELQQINDTLTAEIERIGADTEKGKKLAQVLADMKKSISSQADDDVVKAEWDEFKSSELFLQFFKSAEFATTRSINQMLSQLEKFKDGLSQEDDVELMRAVVNEMEKLERIKIERAPFFEMVNSFKDLAALRDKMKGTSLTGLSIFGVSDVESFNSKKQIDTSISQIDDAIKNQQNSLSENAKKGNQAEVDSINSNIEALKEKKEELEKLKAQGASTSDALKESFNLFGAKLTEIGSSLPQMQSHLENMGITFSDGLSDAIETTSEAFTGLGSALQGFASGNYIQGVMGVLQTLGALFQVGDKKKERQIQREIELVEKLAKQYEKLEKQINETYNIDTFDAANKNAEANLEQQIAATKNMIALEEDKKKADEDKIKEYKEQLDELNDKLEELEANRIQSLGGFGSKEAYKSASQEFVDAWIEAYKETGDGLVGLEEQFDEFFLNMVKNQVLLRGVDKFLDPFYEAFDSMFSEDSDMGSKVSKEEIAKMKEQWENTMPELSDFIESLVESMGVATDLRKGSDELSGLQRGIQGVTESTAQIIEGYLNSIRFFVAEKHRILSDFITNFNNPEVDNPMLSQLKIIATRTNDIKTLIESLIAPHPTQAGAGLKVIV